MGQSFDFYPVGGGLPDAPLPGCIRRAVGDAGPYDPRMVMDR